MVTLFSKLIQIFWFASLHSLPPLPISLRVLRLFRLPELPTFLPSFLPSLLTYLPTPCNRVLEKLKGSQLVKKLPAFYGIRILITVFTRTLQLFLILNQINTVQANHSTSWTSTLILTFRLCLHLPIGLFSSSFPTKTLCTSIFSPIRSMCPLISFFSFWSSE